MSKEEQNPQLMEKARSPAGAGCGAPGRLGPGLLVVSCLLGMPGISPGAEPVQTLQAGHDRAAAAMQRGDYAVAFCAWRPLAEAGDAEAQHALGWMFHNGYGLAVDDAQAELWWKRAAEQGHADAMFSLGTLYSLGSDTVPRDFSMAMHTWAESALLGHKDSQTALRQLAARGVPEIEEAAMALLSEQPDAFGEPEEVKVAQANVRRGPGTWYRVVTVVERGMPVVELLRRGNWAKVGVGSPPQIGWIYGTLIGEQEQLAADSLP